MDRICRPRCSNQKMLKMVRELHRAFLSRECRSFLYHHLQAFRNERGRPFRKEVNFAMLILKGENDA